MPEHVYFDTYVNEEPDAPHFAVMVEEIVLEFEDTSGNKISLHDRYFRHVTLPEIFAQKASRRQAA